MSNENELAGEPSLSRKTRNFIGFAGCILVFLFILFVAYLPNRPEPVDQEIIEERLNRLDEARRAARSKMEQYAVIDRADGVFRIPVERAQRLLVEELRSQGAQEESSDSDGSGTSDVPSDY